MSLFRLLLGIAMLTMGRRLYWLFLGGVGFVFGFDLAGRMVHGQPHDVILVIALISGVIGAALALFLQKFAIITGGFFAGGYLLIGLLKEFGTGASHYYWILFLIGGIAGALLMKVLFSWTLVILSSAIGSILILQTWHLSQQTKNLLLIFLLVLGIAIQYGLFGRKSSPRRT